ncbi:MAG: sugar ABC transporter ATP-binding protein [Alphaproteobacteria bacterium]|nr:sugar ABC transporter ATP-binding protein [Alphaproteobacteria bacterium]
MVEQVAHKRADDSDLILQLEGISKRYGGVKALSQVDFSCKKGSIHAILGENGAGKSTLIKIISGVVQPTEGTLKVAGQVQQFASPTQASEYGVVCIFQELSLIPDLSVADNICITDPPRNRFGLIDKAEQIRVATDLLARVNCADVNPRELVKNLPLSRRQMVEIAKALGRKPKLLILDEATSALSAADVEKVYEILRGLREEGLTMLYISHRMHEIEELADRLSVFRNGEHIETFDKGARSNDEIIEMMIGREYSSVFPPKPTHDDKLLTVLEVENLSWDGRLNNVSLTLGEGEIIGLGGLDGQGQHEILLALFGVLRGYEGKIKLHGKEVAMGSPKQAKSDGSIALIPEDRKTEGLMLPMSIQDNISIATLDQLTKGLIIDKSAEAAKIAEMIEKMSIKIGNVDDAVATLSGGNQQKVVIAKWLMTGAKIVLLDDPTRGIDVGTKQELYQLFRDLADSGHSIILYSTDYDELIGCCDRVSIFYQGEIIRELTGDEINETNIVAASLNMEISGQQAGTMP